MDTQTRLSRHNKFISWRYIYTTSQKYLATLNFIISHPK